MDKGKHTDLFGNIINSFAKGEEDAHSASSTNCICMTIPDTDIFSSWCKVVDKNYSRAKLAAIYTGWMENIAPKGVKVEGKNSKLVNLVKDSLKKSVKQKVDKEHCIIAMLKREPPYLSYEPTAKLCPAFSDFD